MTERFDFGRPLGGARLALVLAIALSARLQSASAQGPPALHPGDLVVADGLLNDVGGILRVDPVTGAQAVIAQGGNFVLPTGVAISPTGQIYVADIDAVGGGGAIFRVDPVTGTRRIVSSNASPGALPFVDPSSIAFDASGSLIVGDPGPQGGTGTVFRVDPVTGARETLSTGGRFVDPTGVAVVNGKVYVADGGGARANPGRIFRIDDGGVQTLITEGGDLLEPFGLAATPDGNLVVADTGALNDLGRIVRVDLTTNRQLRLASGGDVFEPFGIAVAPDGTIYFTDANPNQDNASVFSITPLTRQITRISIGGDLIVPLGIAIVAPEPTALGLVFACACLLCRRRRR